MTIEKKLNFLIIQTDQQRQPMDWPAGWAEKHLPALQSLRETGVSFENAFTACCACTPSRAAMHTSSYPAKNMVTTTFSGTWSSGGVTTLRDNLPNFSILREQGYDITYKGKWHLTYPVVNIPEDTPNLENWTAFDPPHLLARFGYGGWNPPDAGNAMTMEDEGLKTLGGGHAENDTRFLSGATERTVPGYGQSMLEYLERRALDKQPFCLFTCFVNPHDIWVAPDRLSAAGYNQDFLKDPIYDEIQVPPNWDASLDRKPAIQTLFRDVYDKMSPVDNEDKRLLYVRFYAYLQRLVDRHTQVLLDRVRDLGLLENTLIVRIADHGEMGLAQGLREKMFTCYEQAIHVPMIFSNPSLAQGKHTRKMASLVDLLPTLASLAGIDKQRLATLFDGDNLSAYLFEPDRELPADDHIHFTYDETSTDEPGYPPYIRAVRSHTHKYAVYFQEDGSDFQYEMYDLVNDPGENNNMAYWETLRQLQQSDQKRFRETMARLEFLDKLLQRAMTRYGTRPTIFHWPIRPDYLAQWNSQDSSQEGKDQLARGSLRAILG